MVAKNDKNCLNLAVQNHTKSMQNKKREKAVSTEVLAKFCVKNLWQSVSLDITNSKVKQKQNNQHNTIKSQKISK